MTQQNTTLSGADTQGRAYDPLLEHGRDFYIRQVNRVKLAEIK